MNLRAYGLTGLVLAGALAATGCPNPTTSAPPSTVSPKPTGASASPSASPTASPSGQTSGANAEKEPNNDFAEANALTLGTVMSATFDAGDDTDTFKVTIPAGAEDGRLKVTITENSDVTPVLTYYNSAKSEQKTVSAADHTTTPFVSSLDVTAGKDYYLKHTGNGTTAYTIKAEFIPAKDAFERNDSFETAKDLPLGTATDLVLFAGVDTKNHEDEDYFKVTVPEGKTQIKVVIENKSTSDEAQSHVVTLYNSAKEDLASASSSNDQANLDRTFDVEGAGTYYLKFYANNNSPVASKVTVTTL